MPTRNINLTEHLDGFVEQSVAAGRYQNASEVMREALRLLEERQNEWTLRLERLRVAAREGLSALERGEYVEFDDDELEDRIAALGREADRLAKSSG